MQLWKRLNELTITKKLIIGAGAVIQVAGKLLDLTELSSLDGQPVSLATATTPATGTCAVQFTLKDSKGVAITYAYSTIMYASNSTGLATGAVTSCAVLTNGMVIPLSATLAWQVTTSAAGLLGVTLTASAGTYYLAMRLPNGKLLVSDAIVVN